MSKSLKNTVSVKELLQNYSSDTFRLACLMSHYRSSMEYSENMCDAAENVLSKFKFVVNDCNTYINGKIKGSVNRDVLNAAVADSYEEIHSALMNDFDTTTVIKTLNKTASLVSKMLHSRPEVDNVPNIANSASLVSATNLIVNTLNIFGINLGSVMKLEQSDVSDVMNVLNDFRQSVRQLGIERKDTALLGLCDFARSNVKKCGITINDYGKQSSWVK